MSALRSWSVGVVRRAGLVEPLLAVRDRVRDLAIPLRRLLIRPAYRVLATRHPELLLAYHDGAWELARRDDRLVARDAMTDNLELVATALARHGVRYFVLPTPVSPNRYRIGVPAQCRSAALDALLDIPDPAVHLYLDDPGLARRRRRIALRPGVSRRVRARVLRRPVWRIYVNVTDAGGRTVLGHIYGCEVEFWTEAERADDGSARSLLAIRWNRHATELPADVAVTGTLQVRDRAHTTVPELAVAPHFEEVAFPIDLVYTWVDGSDPAWLDRKNAVLRELDLGGTTKDAYDAARYRNHDELKYSLRSVAMFADWVRHVFIVTDDQTPEWLNVENPRVTVVHHKEIFQNSGRLPTFNSHAIEARLHHIDGLAEHYIYLNDDFLFCRRVLPSLFFLSNGMTRFFPSTALIGLAGSAGTDRSVDDAALNSQALIRRHFGRLTHQKLKHAPYAQRRSVLFEAEEVFAEEFARTTESQVRSCSDLPVASAFSHYYGYLTGRAVPGPLTNRYIELSADDFDRRLRNLERRRSADTVCINDAVLDGTRDVLARERRLQEFLDTCWPVKSEFEL